MRGDETIRGCRTCRAAISGFGRLCSDQLGLQMAGETARALDVSRAAEQQHLTGDAQFAEDLTMMLSFALLYAWATNVVARRLCLAYADGGGVVMAVCVRPWGHHRPALLPVRWCCSGSWWRCNIAGVATGLTYHPPKKPAAHSRASRRTCHSRSSRKASRPPPLGRDRRASRPWPSLRSRPDTRWRCPRPR